MNKDIDVTGWDLRTKRLRLRPWREEDLQDFYNYASVPGVGEMAGWKHHKDLEESERILRLFIDEKKTLALDFEGTAIGSIGIERYNEEDYPEMHSAMGRELGYVLSKDYWGKGLMVEAAQAVIDYLFQEELLEFIVVGHFAENEQSKRVIKKLGFTYKKDTVFSSPTGDHQGSTYILERV